MRPVIYIHIGTNKTGSSAIQKFCTLNRDILKKNGILYPVSGASNNAHFVISECLGFGVKKENDKKLSVSNLKDKIIVKKLRSNLFREIESSQADSVLISSEHFVKPRNLKLVKRFLSPADIKIIVYLRRHDFWWESLYNQAVKTVEKPPWNRGLSNYIEFQTSKRSHLGKYRQLVDCWADEFGKENIIVRPYEAEQLKPDIISDIFNAMGRQDIFSKIDMRTERVNESVSFEALSLIDLYQRADIRNDVKIELIKHARSLPSREANASDSSISPFRRLKLIKENIEDYEYIAREYLGREDGVLFYSDLPSPDSEWQRPQHPSYTYIIEQTVKAMSR